MNMSEKLKIESGIQLLARLTKKPNIGNFYPRLFQTGPASGDLIEIFSDTCTSPILIDIICEALTCTKSNENPAEVLIFETDGNLDYEELKNILTRKIWTCNMSMDNTELRSEVQNTLTRLHILNIYDATQFYTTIYNLENTLVEYPGIALIIFNTLTAFYWSEQGFKITRMDLYAKNLINIIQKVSREYKIICMYTRPDYFCTNKDSECLHMEVNYQIQLADNNNGNYQANVKTANTKLNLHFKIVDGDIEWL